MPKWRVKAMGHSPAGLFGFSHMLGGYAGGQAEYLRVPMADVGPIKIPDNVTDEQALFLSDIFPTGYMAAENAQIEDGDTVAIWGCGPVGQFAIRSAIMLGAGRVIAIDEVPERLAMAEAGGAETIDFSKSMSTTSSWNGPTSAGRIAASTRSAARRPGTGEQTRSSTR